MSLGGTRRREVSPKGGRPIFSNFNRTVMEIMMKKIMIDCDVDDDDDINVKSVAGSFHVKK